MKRCSFLFNQVDPMWGVASRNCWELISVEEVHLVPERVCKFFISGVEAAEAAPNLISFKILDILLRKLD